MHRSSKIFVLAVCGIIFSLSLSSLYGENIDPFIMPSARAAALGGNHVALSDDFYAIFSNPAAFVGIKEEFSAAELSLSVYGPMFEVLDQIISHSDSWEGLELDKIFGKRGFAAGIELGGPLSLGWIGRGMGLGLFNRIKTDFIVSGTTIQPIVYGDLLLVGGYSFRLINVKSNVLDAGFLGKGFYRGTLNMETPLLGIMDMFNDVTETKPFQTALGLGFDLGLKYTFRENLTAALVFFDAYSPAFLTKYPSWKDFQEKTGSTSDYATVKPRLDLGVKYRIRSQFLDRYFSNFIVLVDYQDFIDLFSLIPRNPILQMGLGVELTLLDALSLRIGIAEGLPSAGFGIDLSFMQFDFAIHGKELGLDPGIQSTYAVDVGILFRY
jgi:hypothetical protein